MKDFIAFIAVVAWLCGIVLAHGFWKFAAFLVPPLAWYFIAEAVMRWAGIVS